VIALAKAEAFDLIAKLPLKVLSSFEVRQELQRGVDSGHPRLDPPWIEYRELLAPLAPVLVAELDVGEASVIQLAQERGISAVCIDERRGRRLALSLGLEVTGTLGKMPVAGQENQLVAGIIRDWAAQIGQIHVSEQADPSVSVELMGVNLDPIIAKAKEHDTPAARRRVLRSQLFEALMLVKTADDPVPHKLPWKGTDRKGAVTRSRSRARVYASSGQSSLAQATVDGTENAVELRHLRHLGSDVTHMGRA